MKSKTFANALILIVLLGIPIVVAGMAFFAVVGARFIDTNPSWYYDGFSVSVSRNRVHQIDIEGVSSAKIFVDVKGTSKLVRDLDVDDLKSLGFFEQSFFYVTSESPICSIAHVELHGKVTYLNLTHEDPIPFSAGADKPFLKLPVPTKEFIAQFGKPKSRDGYFRRGFDAR